jgi:hypothetical protein
MSKTQFKLDKKQVMDNIVYLVIDNPHENNYGYFQGLFPTMEKAIGHICGDSLENIQEFLDMDEETQPTQNDISNFFELSSPSIIPVFGLDKSKPMYVEINGNNFYMGVVTQEKVEGKNYKKYNFSK